MNYKQIFLLIFEQEMMEMAYGAEMDYGFLWMYNMVQGLSYDRII